MQLRARVRERIQKKRLSSLPSQFLPSNASEKPAVHVQWKEPGVFSQVWAQSLPGYCQHSFTSVRTDRGAIRQQADKTEPPRTQCWYKCTPSDVNSDFHYSHSFFVPWYAHLYINQISECFLTKTFNRYGFFHFFIFSHCPWTETKYLQLPDSP